MNLSKGLAEKLPPASVAVLVSLKIKPYLDTIEGLREIFNEVEIDSDVFFMDNFKGKSYQNLKNKLLNKNFSLFVSIGPEASRFMWTEFQNRNIPKLYTMVLHPEKMPEAPQQLCGIPLAIPIKIQIQEISKALPDLKQLGLLFDPQYNSDFFSQALEKAYEIGLTIIPLKVSSKKEIPLILKNFFNKVDGIWMIPDRTVISESIIQYIIKESLLNGIPVIGYNRFFYESGAVMNFILDYKTLGKQTGKLAIEVLTSSPCRNDDPDFKIWFNQRVLKKIGLTFIENNSKGIISEP